MAHFDDAYNLASHHTALHQTRLLTAEEERALGADARCGDRNARDCLVQANLRLVLKIAREFLGRGLPLDDLVSEGNLGLMRAAVEYDPSYGTRFSTYASYWIKQAIRHALINTTATIRLPAHMVGLLTKWRRVERNLAKELGYHPTDEQVAIALGLTDIQKSLVVKGRQARKLRYESDDGGTWTLDDSADTSEEAVDVSLEIVDERADLLRRLDQLDPRERAILSHRFGLSGELPLTLKETGQRLGITREWVRKIEIRAIRKLNRNNKS